MKRLTDLTTVAADEAKFAVFLHELKGFDEDGRLDSRKSFYTHLTTTGHATSPASAKDFMYEYRPLFETRVPRWASLGGERKRRRKPVAADTSTREMNPSNRRRTSPDASGPRRSSRRLLAQREAASSETEQEDATSEAAPPPRDQFPPPAANTVAGMFTTPPTAAVAQPRFSPDLLKVGPASHPLSTTYPEFVDLAASDEMDDLKARLAEKDMALEEKDKVLALIVAQNERVEALEKELARARAGE